MANLSNLLKTKQAQPAYSATNLERGKIYTFSPNNVSTFPCVYDNAAAAERCHFCWFSPDKGTAIIEIWGSAGSGGKMCCCGGGIPGNPPAYAKKTIEVKQDSYICGFVGHSCYNNALCFKGCSQSTNICYDAACCNGCMCAMGGRGGWSFCSCNSATYTPYCRFIGCCFAGTAIGSGGCGIICNYTDYPTAGFNATDWMACAYGGDVNCCGGWSCTHFTHCNACCYCCRRQYIEIAAGVFSTCRSRIVLNHACSNSSGAGTHYFNALYPALSGLSRSPTTGTPIGYCWTPTAGANMCGCYEGTSCGIMLGVGVPGPGASFQNDIRDHALRGGVGLVRIQFIAK